MDLERLLVVMNFKSIMTKAKAIFSLRSSSVCGHDAKSEL